MAGRYRERFAGDSGNVQIGQSIVSSMTSGTIYGKYPEYRYFRGREWMMDAKHQHWRAARASGLRDAGGPMHHFKCWADFHPAYISHWGSPGFDARYEYTGELYPLPPNFILGDDHGVENSVPETTVVANGTIGFARFKPNAPGGGLGQFLGELHDLPRLPSIFTRHRARMLEFSGMGGDFLNIEFGWRPFLRDVQDTIRNAMTAEKRLNQLVRDNGRLVRRKGVVSRSQDKWVEDHGYSLFAWPSLPSFLYQGLHHRYIQVDVGYTYNFAGAFRYWIPTTHGPEWGNPESQAQRERLARIVYGVELNPRLIYQLMPWSWLIDWGTSLGAVISNFADNQADSLVADYAYCTGSLVRDKHTKCES